jgi:hypothetical protein
MVGKPINNQSLSYHSVYSRVRKAVVSLGKGMSNKGIHSSATVHGLGRDGWFGWSGWYGRK